jgi:hypothetical protein
VTFNHASYQPVDGDTTAPFSNTAMGWPLTVGFRDTEEGNSRGPGVKQAHLVCFRCGQSVSTLSPDLAAGTGYVMRLAEFASAVLRHVREAHCDGGGILLPG